MCNYICELNCVVYILATVVACNNVALSNLVNNVALLRPQIHINSTAIFEVSSLV